VRALVSKSASGFLGSDQPFHCGQRIGVQIRRHQPRVQVVSFGGPAVVGVLGLVELSVGAQSVEFVPGQMMADRQPERGVGGVAALSEATGPHLR